MLAGMDSIHVVIPSPSRYIFAGCIGSVDEFSGLVGPYSIVSPSLSMSLQDGLAGLTSLGRIAVPSPDVCS